MGIKHIKLEEVDSTQSWLKENISQSLGKNTLVSTRLQNSGLGRTGQEWIQFDGSIAFSFSLKPNQILTLTPLEIAIHIINFFSMKKIELLLKWPNDLLIREENTLKKIGGIISHYENKDQLLIGIGINLKPIINYNSLNFKFPPAGLREFNFDQDDNYHEVPAQIYKYILENRLTPEEVIEIWPKNCCHVNRKVIIKDHTSSTEGIFSGIGENGEALLTNNSIIQKVITGSLAIID